MQLHQCFHDPWGAFGHILKEWWTFPSPSQRSTAPIWLPGSDLVLWPSWKRIYSSCNYRCFPILLRSCINVFMAHEEPLGIYWRNGGPFPPLHSDQQLRFGCLGQIWHFDPLRSAFTPPLHFDASQFFYAVAWLTNAFLKKKSNALSGRWGCISQKNW